MEDDACIHQGTNSLRTLRTVDVPHMLPDVDASDDLFLLCLFRALSSHVLTSGANLRAEPDLEISLFTEILEGGEEDENSLGEGLPALRAALGLSGAAPVPIVLTRTGEDLDFSAPFFNNSKARPCAVSPEDPILLVATESARRDVERQMALVSTARARVISMKR